MPQNRSKIPPHHPTLSTIGSCMDVRNAEQATIQTVLTTILFTHVARITAYVIMVLAAIIVCINSKVKILSSRVQTIVTR